jgi:hypothetical protein
MVAQVDAVFRHWLLLRLIRSDVTVIFINSDIHEATGLSTFTFPLCQGMLHVPRALRNSSIFPCSVLYLARESERPRSVLLAYITQSIPHPAVFWDVTPCRSCVNRRFGGTFRLHLQGRKTRERGTRVSRWLQTADGILHSYRRENLKSYIFI